ncbi:lysozyme g-like [Acipenser ruthenus]|uniref:lysozyme g-like n=1 Tax=Acipenser ruthenus TaxID=7906 RepID=UPI00156146DC|nr:lysozyme g-like [Acipenser ruthenus]
MACIYGDVTKIDTTGASEKTANQDKLTVKGVAASHKLAEHDLANMNKYKPLIIKVGRAQQMDPCVIAGIISRESRAGTQLKDGWSTDKKGFGLMQVDIGTIHNPAKPWDGEQHLTEATHILIDKINQIKKKFPGWPKEHQFKGGISAYNGGAGNVRSYDKMDIGTTGDDYANDVVARAQWFKTHGY